MPLLGAHMSIAGGLHKAVESAAALGMETVQIFTHSPSQWVVKPATPAAEQPPGSKNFLKKNSEWCGKELSDEAVNIFRKTLRGTRLKSPIAHDCYLINLASPQPDLYRQSIEAFVVDIERAERLGLRYLVTDPGTPTEGDEDAGLKRIANALDECHRRCPGFKVQVLLETTAGQGRSLGHRFEHLARILSLVEAPRRLGVCMDSCHVFAAGYALAPARAYRETMDEFDRVIGLKRLKAFHLNDSKKPLGSRVDRHAHIGHGELGLEPFRLLVNDPRFHDHPMTLETPKKGANDEEMDAVNLATLRGLLKAR